MIPYIWIPAKSFRKGRSVKITGIVLHSADGSLSGDVETLTEGNVSSHWYISRDGTIYHFVDDSDQAFHAGKAISGWTNASTIGIEQEHVDGSQNWPSVQVIAMAHLIAALKQKHGDLDVKGHSEIAVPKGRKQDPLDYPWSQLKALIHSAERTTWSFERMN